MMVLWLIVGLDVLMLMIISFVYNFVWIQPIFFFRGDIFHSIFGYVMSSHVSAIVANFLIENLEKAIFQLNILMLFLGNIFCWWYVGCDA